MLVSVWGGLCGQLFREKVLHSPTLIASSRGIMVPKLPLFAVISACLGTGGLQTRCCHVYSLVVWELCSKDQDSAFIFLFIYCLSLGVFPRSWELCRRMDVSPGSTHVHSSAKSHCNGTSMKHSWSWHWKCGIVDVLQVLFQVWWQEFSWFLRGSCCSQHGQSGGSLMKNSYTFWMFRSHSDLQNMTQTGNFKPQNCGFLLFPLCLSTLLNHCCCQTSTGRWEHWVAVMIHKVFKTWSPYFCFAFPCQRIFHTWHAPIKNLHSLSWHHLLIFCFNTLSVFTCSENFRWALWPLCAFVCAGL